MKPTLVTGATGFIGWHVARTLLERGFPLRALVRCTGKLRSLGVEEIVGDLRDTASVERAVQGCAHAFHVAADYRLWARNPRDLYCTNVDGTRNLLEAARRRGLERVVYTSTVGCIGLVPNGEGNEETPVSLHNMAGAYKRSKFLAEQIALQYARDGFPVVIVNPTAPVGERDWKPTPTGNIILRYQRGSMPAYVNTGLNLVDVRDTADGHWLAFENGRPGERYILGSQNLTLHEVFKMLEEIGGQKAPTCRIPYWAAYAAGLVSSAWALLSGGEPRVPLDGVRMARKRMFVSTEKARRDLGFSPSPVGPALARAVKWFQDNRYC